jgi:hypothetical protein
MWSPITPPKINIALAPHSNGKRGRDLSIFIVVFHVMPIVGKGYGEAFLSRSGFTCLVISKNDKNIQQKTKVRESHHRQHQKQPPFAKQPHLQPLQQSCVTDFIFSKSKFSCETLDIIIFIIIDKGV